MIQIVVRIQYSIHKRMLYLNLGVSAAAAEAKQSSVTTYLVLLLVGLGSIVPAATGHRFASARATKQSRAS